MIAATIPALILLRYWALEVGGGRRMKIRNCSKERAGSKERAVGGLGCMVVKEKVLRSSIPSSNPALQGSPSQEKG